METISRFLLTFLLNSLWQIPLTAAVASLTGWLMRHSPASHRHIVCVAALAGRDGPDRSGTVVLAADFRPGHCRKQRYPAGIAAGRVLGRRAHYRHRPRDGAHRAARLRLQATV